MAQKCVLVRKEVLDETLKSAPVAGKHLLEPLKSSATKEGLPFNILEDHEVKKYNNEVEVHRHEGDLWFCLEGEATFVYGGELVAPWAKKLPDGGVDDREIKSKEIDGGSEVILKVGDLFWIPAGQPHTHYGTARLMIIKIPAKELVPLDAVPVWKR